MIEMVSCCLFPFQGRTAHLRHVYNVLQRLGYEEGTLSDNWDVLWSHPYPFTVLPELKQLQTHQKVIEPFTWTVFFLMPSFFPFLHF